MFLSEVLQGEKEDDFRWLNKSYFPALAAPDTKRCSIYNRNSRALKIIRKYSAPESSVTLSEEDIALLGRAAQVYLRTTRKPRASNKKLLLAVINAAGEGIPSPNEQIGIYECKETVTREHVLILKGEHLRELLNMTCENTVPLLAKVEVGDGYEQIGSCDLGDLVVRLEWTDTVTL